MRITLDHPSCFIEGEITITGSKSESNRLLVLKSLFPQILIENLSNSDDTLLTNRALKSIDSIINIHHAGTAMRFLTAYFATQQNREVVLTGSQRMQERPIRLLVDALKYLGEHPGIRRVFSDGLNRIYRVDEVILWELTEAASLN